MGLTGAVIGKGGEGLNVALNDENAGFGGNDIFFLCLLIISSRLQTICAL